MNQYDHLTLPDPQDPPDVDAPPEVDIASNPNRTEAIAELKKFYISTGVYGPDVEDSVIEVRLDLILQEMAMSSGSPLPEEILFPEPLPIKAHGHTRPKHHERAGYTKNHGRGKSKSQRKASKASRRRNRTR